MPENTYNVLFLCTGNAARSHPVSAHWGVEDRAAVEGTEEEKRAAFSKIFKQIAGRMNVFVNLPVHVLGKNTIRSEMQKIGDTPV